MRKLPSSVGGRYKVVWLAGDIKLSGWLALCCHVDIGRESPVVFLRVQPDILTRAGTGQFENSSFFD